MTAKQLLKLLEQNGWIQCRSKGSHRILRHPSNSEHICVPFHPGDLPTGTLQKILKQANLK
ncbi:MAG: type II toxin-antitoxin system HicA family toxin [Candidatus Sumerlaeia bacterium]|nr:type II toxin-antitoxin system HicA family toxin [Candidatus Sumerlaeia bacterium]